MSIRDFCRSRIQALTDEFRDNGACSGEIYECCYLTYLEIHEVSRGRSSDDVWNGWIEILEEKTGKKEPLNRSLDLSELEGRDKLIDQLDQFRLKLATPIGKQATVVPPEPKTTEPIDEFDLFFGD